MKQEELNLFRMRLLAEKSRVLEQLEQIMHNPRQFEGDYFELAALGERQRYLQQNLEEIVRALDRIEEGTYGLSEISGKPIPRERLEALPWTNRLVEETEERFGRHWAYR